EGLRPDDLQVLREVVPVEELRHGLALARLDDKREGVLAVAVDAHVALDPPPVVEHQAVRSGAGLEPRDVRGQEAREEAGGVRALGPRQGARARCAAARAEQRLGGADGAHVSVTRPLRCARSAATRERSMPWTASVRMPWTSCSRSSSRRVSSSRRLTAPPSSMAPAAGEESGAPAGGARALPGPVTRAAQR